MTPEAYLQPSQENGETGLRNTLSVALEGFSPRPREPPSGVVKVNYVASGDMQESGSGTGTQPSSPHAELESSSQGPLLEQIGMLLASVDSLHAALRNERAHSCALEEELAAMRVTVNTLKSQLAAALEDRPERGRQGSGSLGSETVMGAL
ncbi:hypothetical protein ACKKBF_B13310 [Auxenochlorella protothecoides x Auxenochlorella symbiontica]